MFINLKGRSVLDLTVVDFWKNFCKFITIYRSDDIAHYCWITNRKQLQKLHKFFCLYWKVRSGSNSYSNPQKNTNNTRYIAMACPLFELQSLQVKNCISGRKVVARIAGPFSSFFVLWVRMLYCSAFLYLLCFHSYRNNISTAFQCCAGTPPQSCFMHEARNQQSFHPS